MIFGEMLVEVCPGDHIAKGYASTHGWLQT